MFSLKIVWIIEIFGSYVTVFKITEGGTSNALQKDNAWANDAKYFHK